MLDQNHRLQIIKAEVEDNSKLDVSDVEFSMPQPSYTIDTLVRLKEEHPEHEYALIMGLIICRTFISGKTLSKF